MELGGSEVVYTDLTVLLSNRPVAADAAAVDVVRAGHLDRNLCVGVQPVDVGRLGGGQARREHGVLVLGLRLVDEGDHVELVEGTSRRAGGPSHR